ncbi:hypothetical protein WJX81_000325 [Elliptochloris bilobata]|uniref:DNA repair metallo-beta-lactamase domain-containing protein n=1 Tax=Elliptochloris bilobata TaxID=381761 RepID=A0AAW1SCH4_9CHLO
MAVPAPTRGLEAHTAAFERAGLTPAALPALRDHDLRELGMVTLGPRRRLIAAATADAQPACSDAQHVAPGDSGLRRGHGGVSGPGKHPVMAAARRGIGGASASARRALPEWQAVPGTRIVVDRFGRAAEQASGCRSWILTHFHSDHYRGLTTRFKAGVIYCTLITATLVHQQLKVPWERLRVVELGRPVLVGGVRVTFLDANHCPGAAMALLEPPGRPPVLHTGDCRWHSGMAAEAALVAVRGRCNLVLDTTYCAPHYTFPPQPQVVQFVLEAVRAEAFNPGTLFLFGCYTIGKERLFLEVARALQRKVYVSASKLRVLQALGLPPEYSCLLTTNDKAAHLQAVPLWRVRLKHMARILRHYRGRYNTIVAFRPCGWAHNTGRGRTGRGRRRQEGTLIIYQVPYSEHSSFEELRQAVAWLQPRRLVPSVGNDGGPRAAEMVRLLRAPGPPPGEED